MTSQEWADAADRGNPETLGRALLQVIGQAHTEARESTDGAPDIGELDPRFEPDVAERLLIRAGELLRERGWIKP